MYIILVSNRIAKPWKINLSLGSVGIITIALIALSLGISFMISWTSIHLKLPFVSHLVYSVQQESNRKSEEHLRDNLALMASKLGEMQAQMLRLDALSERLSKLTGLTVQKTDAQGGPLIPLRKAVSVDDLERDITRFSTILEQRNERLTELESQLMEHRIKSNLLPTLMPIKAKHIGSGFGQRIDPIAGVSALHEGIDFSADIGTAIIASAGGVVVTAEYHPQYGNVIEIDHGNDFSSRYAHLARIDVKPGQLVKRNQAIALSGNSGRSTGPHLHFEVRFKGVPQNPARFLRQGSLTLASAGEAHFFESLAAQNPRHSGAKIQAPARVHSTRKSPHF